MAMSSGSSRGGSPRLERCIRDLVALNALPSMCVGKSPEEALEIILDFLPTALSCDLLYLYVPGTPPMEGGTSRDAKTMTEAQLAELRLVAAAEDDGASTHVFLPGGKLSCLEAEIPLGAERGRLLVGRASALDDATDRVLVRAAANILGTILQTANVLEAARRKDDFLAILGHELRNPLAPILTAVELMERHPEVHREREVIERHTRHLTRLVDDLLDISRVTRGHVELRKEDVSLASVLERAAEIAAPLVARNGHQLRIEDGGDVAVRGDPVRLAQIFGNLLTNAAKFTAPGGKIDVLVERTPGHVCVVVRDNGRGIAPEEARRIFEPFVQADRAHDALSGGLGLGLAIVRNLVHRHGGTIELQSEGRGKGAAFTVELPTIACAAPPQKAATAQSADARARVRILLVDDNTDLADLLAEALKDEGFHTAVAADGHSALAQWRTFRPHAGVLDVGLPDVDGYELAKQLRAEYGRDATLIAATGYGRPTDRLRAADAGFDCHMVKPVSVDELVILLDERVVSTKS
jgi:signal transduction histidine kinase/ActR/RegA family two-component response regulator